MAYGYIYGQSPEYKSLIATGSVIARLTEDKELRQTISLFTDTKGPTNTPVILTSTLTPLPTPTATLDPSITPPTSTNTYTSTKTYTPTRTSTKTLTRTKSPSPTATRTNIPSGAGLTSWLIYKNTMLGVRELVWDKYLGYYRPETGKIFVSIYIIALNRSDKTVTFSPMDISIQDGGGELSGRLLFSIKEPSFSSCTVVPNGTCEGWWTTEIWDRPEVRQKLILRWTPSFWDPTLETSINQNP
jgi:hypothetical protein